VSIIFLYRQVLFQYVTIVMMLQNAAKHGKLMESYGNFGGAKFVEAGEASPMRASKMIFLTMRSVAKNELWQFLMGLRPTRKA
jgi:hypothetical protein